MILYADAREHDMSLEQRVPSAHYARQIIQQTGPFPRISTYKAYALYVPRECPDGTFDRIGLN